jgi:hypothetical protein
VVATYLQLFHADWLYSWKLLTTVGLTTAIWLPVTYLTPPVDDATLVDFVRRVRPGSPGWNVIYRRHGIRPEPFLGNAVIHAGLALVGLFGLNFGIGNLLLGHPGAGVGLLGLAAVALVVLALRIRRQRAAAAR